MKWDFTFFIQISFASKAEIFYSLYVFTAISSSVYFGYNMLTIFMLIQLMVHFLVNLIDDFGFLFPFFSKSWLVVVYNGHSNNLKNTITD